MDIEEFTRLLYTTAVPSSFSETEKIAKVEPLQQHVFSSMPKQLYRYRRCDERSLESFYKDQIWVSTAECMNDGFDARLYFDKQEIITWLNRLTSEESQDIFIQRLTADLNTESGNTILPGMEPVIEKIKSAPMDQLKDAVRGINKLILSDSSEALVALTSIAQQTIKFGCFSQRIDSAAMWGHYASDESGFALAYDFRSTGLAFQNDSGLNRQCAIFPMVYGTERYRVPTGYIQYMIQYRLWNQALQKTGYAQFAPNIAHDVLKSVICPDELGPIKIALHKSEEWKYEAEWRVFCSSNNDPNFQNAKHGYFIKAPVALYLGRRISSIYEKILTDIAKEKKIPVYKMRLNDDSATYNLVPNLVPSCTYGEDRLKA